MIAPKIKLTCQNRIENLQIISRSEHIKLEHSRGVYKDHLTRLNGGYYDCA